MRKVILISGYAEHGKDSVANIIKDILDTERTLILHNADYLKFIAKQYCGWDGNKDIKGRSLLQKLGTEKVRMKLNKPLFWTDKVCEAIDILYDDFEYFIVPDTRFRNEIFYPQAKFPDKVITIRVKRLNYENSLTPEQRLHASEVDLASFPHDYYIESESGLDNLKKEVVKFINAYSL